MAESGRATTIGRYELLVPIGAGGMGKVFLASARGGGGFERRVALKLLDDRLASSASFVRAFVEEATLAAQIHHPNVVAVLDVGDSPAFMVMDYVEGDTLAGLVAAAKKKGEAVPLRILLRILDDALAGLHAAHELTDPNGAVLGVIHRDFSPQNVLVGADGVTRLTDFGVAKVGARGDRTAAGVVKGKLGYMSPEQLTGKKLDRRSDVWSAGVVLWEAISGKQVVGDDGPSLTDDPPRLATALPDVPPALDEAIASALTVEVDDRCRSVAELRRRVLAGAQSLAQPATAAEVAGYVRRILGDELRERARAVATVLAERAEVPSKVALEEPGSGSAITEERYTPLTTLGTGGMGRVVLVRDHSVGREVALKELLPDARGEQAAARFRREARLQGQLEHPAIVPVYDVGTNSDGMPFFTMKRVRGEVLSDVLTRLAAGDEPTKSRFTRRRLLSSFVQLCLAIHYAHERGVVHRDIKPDNVMIGDYGEVYVLDWGVAKVDGEEPEEGAPSRRGATILVGSLRTMAPEQASGIEVDARADVYSLGAILYELLTLQPLHETDAPNRMIARIVRGVEARPSVRAPDVEVPPELERLVLATTRKDPAERMASARELAEALEGFLDGDRDLELRRTAAAEHAATAEKVAAELASASAAPESDIRLRSTALGEVGRALALDAGNRDALRTMVRLLTDPPRVTPPAVVEQRAKNSRMQLRMGAIAGAACYAYILANGLILASFGSKSWSHIALIDGAWTLAALICVFGIFRPSTVSLVTACALGIFAAAISTSAFSPYLIVPTLLQVQATLFSLLRPRLARPAVVVMALVAWTVCVFGEGSATMAHTVDFVEGALCMRSAIYEVPPAFFTKFLYTAGLASIVLPAAVVGVLRRSFDVFDLKMRVQAWQIEQLVPEESTAAVRAE